MTSARIVLLAALVATPVLAQRPPAAPAPQQGRAGAARPNAQAPGARPSTAAPAARPAPGRAANRPAPADTATPDTLRIEYRREVFNYQGGARDPFQTLISSGAVRPTIDDLKLISVAYDARGGNSVAVVRETMPGGAKRMHRLRRGDQIGRLRVIQIQPYQVVFQIEEFGFERQQTLTLQRPEVAR